MVTHISDSHQNPSQNKTKSKLQILENCQKFWNFARNFTRDTPSEVAWSDVWIWNGSNQNCRRYRVDTGCGTDGQTDGRTDGVKPIYPLTTSLCRGYNYIFGKAVWQLCRSRITPVRPTYHPPASTDNFHILYQDHINSFVSDLSSELCQKLAFSLVKFETWAAKACATQSNKNHNLEHLMDLSPYQYAHDSNKPLPFDFIDGIMCGKPRNKNNQESAYEISKSYESILPPSRPVKIIAMHFRETVLLYLLTRTQLTSSILGVPHMGLIKLWKHSFMQVQANISRGMCSGVGCIDPFWK